MDPEDLIALEGMFAASNLTIGDIVEDQLTIVADLAIMDRMSAVSTFGALLASPRLQASAYRIEALAHIAAVKAAGKERPSSSFIQRAFESLGAGLCGRLEDPAEDLFSTAVHCWNGNYTVFEGLREANGFYLQRVLDVIGEMPHKEPFASIRRSTVALLTLSDATARRAGVLPRVIGEVQPVAALPEDIATQLVTMQRWVVFNTHDPEIQQIDPNDLEPFVYTNTGAEMLQQSLGHTLLERYPLLRFGDMLCLALPTAVGASITRYVLETVKSLAKTSAFERALERSYWELLSSTPLIRGAKMFASGLPDDGPQPIRSAVQEVDEGRYLHLVISNDPIEDLDVAGILEVSPACMEQSRLAVEHTSRAAEIVTARSGFRDGITLVIGCGLGRASVFAAESGPENWRIAYLPVHDALTMARMKDFSPLDLWRILDSKAALDSAGISLLNVNGLLNLLAWANDLNGHLVPHANLPDDFRDADANRMIVVNQNAVLSLRESVQASYHALVALDENRKFQPVRRMGGESIFEDDQKAPLYVHERALRDGKLKAVYISGERYWWIEIVPETAAERHDVYEQWRMLYTWLRRTAPALEESGSERLPAVICFRVHFQKINGFRRGSAVIPGKEILEAAFQISVDHSTGAISIRIGEVFDDALASPENIAERALVRAMLRGTSELAHMDLDGTAIASLLDAICSSANARSRHMMPAQDFRDMIRRGSGHPIPINRMDDGLSRLGLAFRVQPDVESELAGIPECTTFLNRASQHVLEEICTVLRSFNREKFIEAILENHESAAIDREMWRRTAHANLALHGEGALDVIAQHIAEMNACSIASRILVEAAVCECPVHGGSNPGKLDISRALTKAILAFHFGGWSDAIHWGAISPVVKVTPLGDIHVDHTFIDTIYTPFTQTGGQREVRTEVDEYSKAYSEPPRGRAVSDVIQASFLNAWEREYGMPIDDLRRFVDALENIGLEVGNLWFKRRRSELVEKLADLVGRSSEDVRPTIDLLTLPTRSHWKTAPIGFQDKDWYPWRFRRRLSLVRRPLIQLDDAPDPDIIVAPAVVREALYILLRSFHSGETPHWQVSSAEMRKWLGHTNNVERTAFNSLVAQKLRDLGWECEPDYKITKLLGISLDKNYGDVDALAWNRSSGRILAIECKDLHFHKTLGEVAEQLSDFRGVVKPNGKRDLLRKHLDRLDILKQNASRVQARLGLRTAAHIQGYIVFRHPVPMQFAWEQMREKIMLLLFDELDCLRI